MRTAKASSKNLCILTQQILYIHTHTHARTHARARTHTHINIYIYICVCVLYINISKLKFISIIQVYENSVSSAIENSVCVCYKGQLVLAAQGSNWYYCENYMTH